MRVVVASITGRRPGVFLSSFIVASIQSPPLAVVTVFPRCSESMFSFEAILGSDLFSELLTADLL